MRSRFHVLLITFLFLLGCTPEALCATESLIVKHVSDGDTFILNDGRKVRMIGVDTPEMHDDARNQQNARRNAIDAKRVKSYSEKAKKFLQQTIEGREVMLDYDWQREDKYGRSLAYVYRASDHLFVNAEIIKQGYGFAYLHFPFKYSKDFISYASDARKNKRGLWS